MSLVDTHNPFSLEPIRTPEQFFGREKETRRALSLLERGQSVSIVGPHLMGKSSFLFHVAHPYVRERHELSREQIFVFLDGHLMADQDQGHCYRIFNEEVFRQLNNSELVSKIVKVQLEEIIREVDARTYYGLQTLCRKARSSGLKLVVMIDSFESLVNNNHLDSGFFSALRALPHNFEIPYLIASRLRLYELERTDDVVSPFFNIFSTIELKPLRSKESRELVVAQMLHGGYRIPEFGIDCILQLGNDEPHHLQRAGYLAFALWQANMGSLLEEHCEQVKRKFLEEVKPHGS